MPAAGGEAAEQGRSRRFIIEMKRLRIVLPGKSLDRRLVDQSLGFPAEFLSRSEIVKIKMAQGVFLLETVGCDQCCGRFNHIMPATATTFA